MLERTLLSAVLTIFVQHLVLARVKLCQFSMHFLAVIQPHHFTEEERKKCMEIFGVISGGKGGLSVHG